ncbi:hypothetical protein FOZ60_006673 [Perkinsus olseni]|uniref:Uncharacterized protein n=1 Tax=Perkinsus olseni TaxID=32597 RepID=A0A7J6NN96_PEROL|nr:hypothetical protein FOZ60_006673 [Perkinsus olseni]
MPNIGFRYTILRFNSLYRSFLLFVYVVHMVEALADTPWATVTADYPKRCNRGPGPMKEGGDLRVMKGTCIYNIRGFQAGGGYQRSAGVIIKTNMPGRIGWMKVQFDIVEGTEAGPEVTVNTLGFAHVGFAHGDMSFWWNPAPGNRSFKMIAGRKVHVDMASIAYGFFPDHKNAWTSWYSIQGDALMCCVMSLSSNVPAKGVPGVSFEQLVYMAVVPDGWQYTVAFQAVSQGGAVPKFNFTQYIANGTLYG